MEEYTVVRNGNVLGYFKSAAEVEEVIQAKLNEYKHLEPVKVISQKDEYKQAWSGKVKPCEIQIWRYERTLYFEQFLIIEGSL